MPGNVKPDPFANEPSRYPRPVRPAHNRAPIPFDAEGEVPGVGGDVGRRHRAAWDATKARKLPARFGSPVAPPAGMSNELLDLFDASGLPPLGLSPGAMTVRPAPITGIPLESGIGMSGMPHQFPGGGAMSKPVGGMVIPIDPTIDDQMIEAFIRDHPLPEPRDAPWRRDVSRSDAFNMGARNNPRFAEAPPISASTMAADRQLMNQMIDEGLPVRGGGGRLQRWATDNMAGLGEEVLGLSSGRLSAIRPPNMPNAVRAFRAADKVAGPISLLAGIGNVGEAADMLGDPGGTLSGIGSSLLGALSGSWMPDYRRGLDSLFNGEATAGQIGRSAMDATGISSILSGLGNMGRGALTWLNPVEGATAFGRGLGHIAGKFAEGIGLGDADPNTQALSPDDRMRFAEMGDRERAFDQEYAQNGVLGDRASIAREAGLDPRAFYTRPNGELGISNPSYLPVGIDPSMVQLTPDGRLIIAEKLASQ